MNQFEKIDLDGSHFVGYRVPANGTPIGLGSPQSTAESGDRAWRMFDLVLATMALIAVFPLMIVIAVLVYLSDRGPIFYAQRRIGKDGKSFYCFKFRSMVTNADARLRELLERDPQARAAWDLDHKLKNDPRITPIGGFLRKSSLDELPQLFNVLMGDMSLVGPRPIVEAEVIRYGRYFHSYCSVRPGITGLWQVNGRNNVSYRRRVAFDVIYARNNSLVLNVKILFATVPAILLSRGSY